MSRDLSVDTLAVRGGFRSRLGEGLSPAIDLSSTFNVPGDADQGFNAYGRSDVPGFQVFERAVADVERAGHGIVFNSGTSAMVALVDEVAPGGKIVFTQDAYHGFVHYARDVLEPRGIEVQFIDLTDLAAIEAALPGASLLWAETPTNPHIRVCDLAEISRLCAQHDVPWVCDN